MTNEEIIQKFAFEEYPENISYSTVIEKMVDYNRCYRNDFIKGAEKMAEWKDQQHSIAYVVTRSDMHYDEVEKVFFDIEKAEQYCANYNNDENEYRRHITKINITL